jgi:hypothetical protein
MPPHEKPHHARPACAGRCAVALRHRKGNQANETARHLPSYAKCYLDSAFAGDEPDASKICLAAPNEYRGWIALAAYYIGVPNPGYHTIIRKVWNHDHLQLLAATKLDRRLIRRMMKRAEFKHPFSGSIDVFRGASGVTLRTALKGLSWTVSRDTACYFACRFACISADSPNPIVLKARVNASDIVFWDRQEEEVVLRRDISAGLDPEPETWADNAKKEAERIKGAQKAHLEA